jgi:hypothetical protein
MAKRRKATAAGFQPLRTSGDAVEIRRPFVRIIPEASAELPSNLVLFQGTRRAPSGPATTAVDFQMSLEWREGPELFAGGLEAIKNDLTRGIGQVKNMVDVLSQGVPTGFAFDSVEVSLGFSAEGPEATYEHGFT